MQQRGKLWKWNMDIWRTQLWNERRLCVRSSRQRIRSIEINIFDTSVRVSCETSWHFIDECHSSHSGPIHCEIRIFSSCALNRIRPHIGSMKLMPPRINCPSDADAKFSSVSSIPLPTAFFLLDYPFYLAQTHTDQFYYWPTSLLTQLWCFQCVCAKFHFPFHLPVSYCSMHIATTHRASAGICASVCFCYSAELCSRNMRMHMP